jgi:hypothetical protein
MALAFLMETVSQYSIKTTSTYFHLYQLQEFNISYTSLRCTWRSPTHRRYDIRIKIITSNNLLSTFLFLFDDDI